MDARFDTCFATALRTFDTPGLKACLAETPAWPSSLVGLPPWVWVVDNAVQRLNEVGTLRSTLTLDDVLRGVKEQMDLLVQTHQDPTQVEWDTSRDRSYGGCLHRLITVGSIKASPHMSALAQCIVENVPEAALGVTNAAGLTAQALLAQMGHGGTEHNVAALHRAFEAREARGRVTQTPPLPERPSQRARRRA